LVRNKRGANRNWARHNNESNATQRQLLLLSCLTGAAFGRYEREMVLNILRTVVGEARCRAFDWRHRVRTCGTAELKGLTIAGKNASHGVFYHPSHPKFLFEVLSSLSIDYANYTFVDLGSGKGRVLLVASEYPFKAITGVEFARELHDVASENIRRYRSASQKCKQVESRHADATEFVFPPGPLVLYLANPFGPGVLVPVLRHLQKSLETDWRDVVMVYTAAFHGDLVEQETSLKCVERSTYHNTYRTPPQS
jgi:predicted RNA methylase